MKIKFLSHYDYSGFNGITPEPASRSLPKWYAKIPRFIGNEKRLTLNKDGQNNATIKWCNPFIDSLTAGYMIYLSNDVMVSMENDSQMITWKSGGDLIGLHSEMQISPDQIPPGYSSQPYKFKNDFGIQTPRGYSALFIHPLNRSDLPFHSLSGFVDTDGYHIPVNFPFVIRADFTGIIEAGTPIAQVIPIKREVWGHSVEDFDAKRTRGYVAKFNGKIYRSYKNLFWKRKYYR
jgi:hypothetical protein